MYASDEDRNAKRELRALTRELEHMVERVYTLTNELKDDDYDRTTDARSRAAEAVTHLRRAAGSFEDALVQLPEPDLAGEAASREALRRVREARS